MATEHDHGHGHDDAHGGGHGGQSRFIQHHFDDGVHQFESGKLGIWLFLAQEVLFFSALFVAYILYRHHHPEIFAYAHHYLDIKMGAINTAVLILSSLSAAWAVRAAQLDQQRLLVGCLVVTLLCAFAFLGIKYIEYSAKIHHKTLFGKKFVPHQAPDGTPIHEAEEAPSGKAPAGEPAAKPAIDTAGGVKVQPLPGKPAEAQKKDAAEHEGGESAIPPPNTGMFFTIYFAMTGLHGIHVLGGVFVFIWLTIRAIRGDFNPRYYGPVDFAALYWHLVDLIWIFLFPLLYLIA